MKKINIFIIAIILISFLLGIYFYNLFPDKIASHWGINGQVDGYMGKFWGLFLMPLISLAMFLLFILIPKIDPLRENIEKFRKFFDRFILFIILFLFYIYILMILWNTGIEFNMNRFFPPAVGLLFYYAGILIENAKRNYFIGIRTPWTLNSEIVWDKTHKLGGKLFKAGGIIVILSVFFPQYAFWFILVPIIAIVIFIEIYSYFVYKKVQKG